jgi:hypothetical protein
MNCIKNAVQGHSFIIWQQEFQAAESIVWLIITCQKKVSKSDAKNHKLKTCEHNKRLAKLKHIYKTTYRCN